jgi:hypothetical protein
MTAQSKAEKHARDPLSWWILVVGLVNLAAHLPAALRHVGL